MPMAGVRCRSDNSALITKLTDEVLDIVSKDNVLNGIVENFVCSDNGSAAHKARQGKATSSRFKKKI
eukprot:1898798-Karenia_brevis.AAC.1